MYDAPGMRVTPDSRGYGVSMPFAAHAAAEPPSQLQATLVKSAKDVFAGTMGGIIVTAIGHPFDTVKVLLQTQPANNPIYSGPIDAVSKVLKSEGIGGLYKGITSPLAGQMFFRATLFFGYARARRRSSASPPTIPSVISEPASSRGPRARCSSPPSICTSRSGSR